MIKNYKSLIAAVLLSTSMFGAGAVFTAGASAQSILAVRGEYASARNIVRAKRGLEGVIDQLSRDNRDFGGHRIAAIADLQRGREELQAALNYDATHGR